LHIRFRFPAWGSGKCVAHVENRGSSGQNVAEDTGRSRVCRKVHGFEREASGRGEVCVSAPETSLARPRGVRERTPRQNQAGRRGHRRFDGQVRGDHVELHGKAKRVRSELCVFHVTGATNLFRAQNTSGSVDMVYKTVANMQSIIVVQKQQMAELKKNLTLNKPSKEL